MRQIAVIATIGLLLLVTVHPRAQAPTLNREVAPLLPVKQIAYLRASNAETLDHFACGGGNQGHTGTSIGISGDGQTLAVGAPFESSGARGVNGNQNDNSVYARAPSTCSRGMAMRGRSRRTSRLPILEPTIISDRRWR